jgi:hypothetical protein
MQRRAYSSFLWLRNPHLFQVGAFSTALFA